MQYFKGLGVPGRWLALLLMSSVLVACTGHQAQTDADPIALSIRQGTQISQALNAYYSDVGIYPGQLEDLKPEYLDPQISLVIEGGEGFTYAVTASDYVGLRFRLGSIECGTSNSHGLVDVSWQCEDRTGIDM